jgi:hypothetical protein
VARGTSAASNFLMFRDKIGWPLDEGGNDNRRSKPGDK